MNRKNLEAYISLAERKRKLLADGASYRSGMMFSRDRIKESLNAESLARLAISHLATSAYSRFENLFSMKGLNLQTLIPLVTGGISLLSKRSLLKPVVRGATVVGALAAVAYFIARKKNNTDVNN